MEVSMRRFALWVLALLLSCTGCTHVLSENARRMADTSITFGDIRQNPEGYVGKMVILGGSIAGVKNSKEGSRMEIVQFDLDSIYFPGGGRSAGRFLAEAQQFLDPMVYKRGRAVTVFGELKGKKTLPLDETDYTYPVLQAREIYLWPEPAPETTLYYPPPPYYDPYYFYGPFDPWYGPYWYRPFGPYRHRW
jgi:outer membrane lipoprotein